jgi:hypothetical protein
MPFVMNTVNVHVSADDRHRNANVWPNCESSDGQRPAEIARESLMFPEDECEVIV